MGERCSRQDCARKGEWYAVILVPPLGGSMQQALQLIVGLPLCRDHASSIDPVDFLTPESRNRVRIALMQRSRAMPDFSRASLDRGRIGDRRWRDFEDAKARARPG